MIVLSTLKMFRKWEVLQISLYSWLGLLSDILPSFSLKDLFAFIFHTRTETSPKKRVLCFLSYGPCIIILYSPGQRQQLSQRPICPTMHFSKSQHRKGKDSLRFFLFLFLFFCFFFFFMPPIEVKSLFNSVTSKIQGRGRGAEDRKPETSTQERE